ncbi:MAG TPA: hypothetical protein VIL34_23820 [Actinopolymorphaceae bacterium]|jgi:hypothetical protein
MPGDFDGGAESRLAERLTLLRTDVESVVWADEETIRRRGTVRHLQRTAATGLAIVAGVGVIGYGTVTGLSGDPTTTDPLAVSPSGTAQAPPRPSQRQGERSPSEHTSDRWSGSPHQPDPSRTTSPAQTGKARPERSPSAEPTRTPDRETESPPAASPSETTPDPTAPVASAESLLVETEMPVVDDSGLTWSTTATSTGEGSAVSSCQLGSLTSLKATSAARRDFQWGTDSTVTGTNVVASFATTADAASAYDTFTGWLEGCTWGTPHGPTEVAVDSGEASWWWVGRDDGDTGAIDVVGLVRRDQVLSVVVWHQTGQDLSYTTDPMAPALRASAQRITP